MTTARLANKLGLNKLKVWEGNLVETVGKSFYQLQTNTLEGKPFYLDALQGKVILVSNIARHCSWSKANFDKIASMELMYRGQLQTLLYPSNEFGNTEPGTPDEIREFMKRYGNRFHLMEKTNVNGPQTHEVFRALKQATGTEDIDITWNYETKFLISKEGHHVERFSNASEPSELVPFIDRLIGEMEPHEDEPHDEDSSMTKSAASYVHTG